MLLALVPLSLAVGWICQVHDEHYTLAGLFFWGAMLLAVLPARRWCYFHRVTVLLLYVVTLSVAYVGFVQSVNANVYAILAGWIVLFSGPKNVIASEINSTDEKPIRQHVNSFGQIIAVIVGLAVVSILSRTFDGKIRHIEFNDRYAAKGCAEIKLSGNRVLCYNKIEALRWVDQYRDYKGKRLKYRIWSIQGNQGILSWVDYASGRIDFRAQVRFQLYEKDIVFSKHGIQIYLNPEGDADTARGTWLYQHDTWLSVEPVSTKHLRRLKFIEK